MEFIKGLVENTYAPEDLMPKAFARYLLLLLLSLSACSQSNQIDAHPAPWPEGRMSVVSMGGAVVFGNEFQDLIVVLDEDYRAKTHEVVVSATELSNAYLIETNDPLGRFLPSVDYVVKELRPLLMIESQQTVSDAGWSLQSIGSIETSTLATALLGSTSIGQLASFLEISYGVGGINILIPVTGPFSNEAQYDIFKTPGSMTVLLVPSSISSAGGSSLLAPVQLDGVSWFSISTKVETLQAFSLGSMLP